MVILSPALMHRFDSQKQKHLHCKIKLDVLTVTLKKQQISLQSKMCFYFKSCFFLDVFTECNSRLTSPFSQPTSHLTQFKHLYISSSVIGSGGVRALNQPSAAFTWIHPVSRDRRATYSVPSVYFLCGAD